MDLNETCHEYTPFEWPLLKSFSRSEVRGKGCDQTRFIHNGGGTHFNGMTSRLASFILIV